MAGETDLATLIRTMRPVLGEEIYVFATIPHGSAVPSGVTPQMTFREAEGPTLILPKREAEAAGLAGAFPCRMVTLDVHSSLELVGFLEAVSAPLAAAGISVNAVSAFHHDHLFVPVERVEEALRILKELAAG